LLDETFQRVDLVHRRLADISAGVAAGRHRRPPATRSRCSNCRPAKRVKACSPFIPFLAPNLPRVRKVHAQTEMKA
jgi:hypothetical protein